MLLSVAMFISKQYKGFTWPDDELFLPTWEILLFLDYADTSAALNKGSDVDAPYLPTHLLPNVICRYVVNLY